MEAPVPAIATVVYEPERAMLQLQARSLDRFLPEQLPGAVVVLDNTDHGLSAADTDELMAAYGRVAPVVRVLRPVDVGVAEEAPGGGWRRQQVLKLAVARAIHASWYLVLDAKHHLLAPLEREHLVAGDGRLRIPVHGYADHPLRGDLERVLRFVGLPVEPYIERFTATVPPFPLRTEVVLSLLSDLTPPQGSFERTFVTSELTEFFLYTAWQIGKGATLDELVDDTGPTSLTIWPRAADEAGVTRVLTASVERGTPVLGVHRRAWPALSPAARDALIRLWVDDGLVASAEEGHDLVVRIRAEVGRPAYSGLALARRLVGRWRHGLSR